MPASLERPNLLWGLSLVLAACQGGAGVSEATAPLLSYGDDYGSIEYNAAGADVAGIEFGGTGTFTPVTMHFVFYGAEWTDHQRQMFVDFANGLSGSPLMNVLSTYVDPSTLSSTPTTFTVDSHWANDEGYSQTQSIDAVALANIVDNQIFTLKTLPYSATDVYMVLLDPTVYKNGLCSSDCAAHGPSEAGPPLNIGWVGNPEYCVSIGSKKCNPPMESPNGDPPVDVMLDFVFHEFAEALTNPTHHGFNGVTTMGDKEVGDLCELAHKYDDGQFQPVGPVELDPDYVSNGAFANINLGGKDYLVQPIWQDVERGGCVRRLALNRPVAQTRSEGGVVGDFDNNGYADLLWRNSTTGDVHVWLLDNHQQPISTSDLGVMSEREQIVSIADFDGDSYSDILWRNLDSGALTLWRSTGARFQNLTLFGGMAANILPKAVGDFDGDGRADILFQDMNTNETRVFWYGSSSNPTWAGLPDTGTQPSESGDYETIGTGDFDNDGHADVLWFDASGSNRYLTWSINRATMKVTTEVFTPNGFSQLLGIVDVDGDGVADLLGFDSLGGNLMWMRMSGGVAQPGQLLRAMPDPEWRYSGASHDWLLGQAVVWWRNRQTGALVYWLLDQTGVHTKSTLTTQAQNWEIVAE